MSRSGRVDVLTPDDVMRLRRAVLRIARAMRQNTEVEVTPTQFDVLALVAARGTLTVTELAKRERVKTPTMSRVVASLEERELVQREVDPFDSRSSLIELTAAGQALLDEQRAGARAWLVQRIDGLSGEDIERLEEALPVLERLVDNP